jgi:hypothetical protein
MPGIQSQSVILVEGDADEIVPNAKLATDMHGFVIMVPPGEGGERLLDMLWRITMAYAGRPSMLRSRTTVRMMVEAVWSKEGREPKLARRPARKRGLADLTVARAESLPDPRSKRKAKSRRKN